MHKRRVLYFREPEVHTILVRQLADKGFRVYPKVGLADAIGKDDGEYLEPRAFDYFTRAHLDFLVVRNDLPVFAIEFDGASHQDATAAERDVLKNRLCKAADLPLLRVTSVEITERDRLTLLDYMLMRHVAWTEEIDGIIEEIRDFAATVPRDAAFEAYDGDFDPHLHFDVRHPFPGSEIVQERLWKNHRIAWTMADRPPDPKPEYYCDVRLLRMGGAVHDQFHKCERIATVWPEGTDRENPVFSRAVDVSIRAWLPLRTDIPQTNIFITDLTTFGEQVEHALKQFEVRAAAMWMPHLPGVSVWDITEHYTEYLGLRAVEAWAKTTARARLAQL